MVGRSVMMLIPEWLQDEEPAILGKIRRLEKVDHFETTRKRKDGTLIEISLTVSPIRDPNGVIVGASKIARDISLRRAMENAARSVDGLARIVAAEEAMRNRIARDLHDHLGQKMTGLRLTIERLFEECGDDGPHREGFEQIRRSAAEIDQDLGFLSWELRPTELEEVGLIDALRTYLGEWSRQYRIPAAFHSYPKSQSHLPRIGSSIETNVYRVAQEALNNTWKHAEASSVAMIVRRDKETLVVVIEDDGKGFDAEGHSAETGPGGFGLSGMRERITLLGGTLEIESGVDRGTSIILKVPLQAKPLLLTTGG
jgi:signal transduction histidine kinase